MKGAANSDIPTTLTLPLIERPARAFKTHRAAIDFDAGFVNSFVPKLEKVVFIWNGRNKAAPEELEFVLDEIWHGIKLSDFVASAKFLYH